MTITYFAYASNMAPEVITRLCPRARYLGVARLTDHRLAFTRRSVRTGTGVADIVPAPGKTVWVRCMNSMAASLRQSTAKRASAGHTPGWR